jgi:hypothetical protein
VVVVHDVVPALTTNVEDVEVEVALASETISQLTGVAAAAHIRSGRLVPLRTSHIAEHLGMFITGTAGRSRRVRGRL